MYTIKTKLYLAILICLGISACKRNEIQTYDGDRYIQFVNKNTDTINVSFFLYPSVQQFAIKLPVKMIGFKANDDLPFQLTVNPLSSAFPELFSFSNTLNFKKAQARDTVTVTIFRKAELKDKEVLLVLDLVANNEFKLGEAISQRQILRISDKISKPSWWNALMETSYLGKYTDKKYRTFIQVVGKGDLEQFSADQQRDFMLEFKYYLIKMKDLGTPVLEDDGKDMLSTVPLIG